MFGQYEVVRAGTGEESVGYGLDGTASTRATAAGRVSAWRCPGDGVGENGRWDDDPVSLELLSSIVSLSEFQKTRIPGRYS